MSPGEESVFPLPRHSIHVLGFIFFCIKRAPVQSWRPLAPLDPELQDFIA